MSKATHLQKPTGASFQFFLVFSTLLLAIFSQAAFADSVFENRKKSQHALSGAEYNKLQLEHKMRFGEADTSASAVNSSNPWDKKRQKNQQPVQQASWAECRDFALTKRNHCYREGKHAYGCEQVYEARVKLCDSL